MQHDAASAVARTDGYPQPDRNCHRNTYSHPNPNSNFDRNFNQSRTQTQKNGNARNLGYANARNLGDRNAHSLRIGHSCQ